jgi:TfoX/Sxy family transcriptional regulator of competence genes
MLRLSEADRTRFLKQAGTRLFEPMPGHPMKEYVEVPDTLLKKPAELRKWVKKGFVYAEGLPPKVKKKGKTQ